MSPPGSRGGYGVDASLVRLAFVVATAAGGVGVAAYLLGWLVIPAGDSGPRRPRIRTGRAAVEVALGTAFLLLAVLFTFRELGIWFSDAVVWPLVLIAGGGALIWRQSMGEPRPPEREPAGAAGPGHDGPGEIVADGAAARRSGDLAHRPRHRARRSPPASCSSRPPAPSARRATSCSP